MHGRIGEAVSHCFIDRGREDPAPLKALDRRIGDFVAAGRDPDDLHPVDPLQCDQLGRYELGLIARERALFVKRVAVSW